METSVLVKVIYLRNEKTHILDNYLVQLQPGNGCYNQNKFSYPIQNFNDQDITMYVTLMRNLVSHSKEKVQMKVLKNRREKYLQTEVIGGKKNRIMRSFKNFAFYITF
jgi:hypothetical protein